MLLLMLAACSSHRVYQDQSKLWVDLWKVEVKAVEWMFKTEGNPGDEYQNAAAELLILIAINELSNDIQQSRSAEQTKKSFWDSTSSLKRCPAYFTGKN